MKYKYTDEQRQRIRKLRRELKEIVRERKMLLAQSRLIRIELEDIKVAAVAEGVL